MSAESPRVPIHDAGGRLMDDWLQSPTFHYQLPNHPGIDDAGYPYDATNCDWDTLLSDFQPTVPSARLQSSPLDIVPSSHRIRRETSHQPNKLPEASLREALRFTPCVESQNTLWSQQAVRVPLTLQAVLKGTFFLTDEQELTCYRRNAFQVEFSLKVPPSFDLQNCCVNWLGPGQAVRRFDIALHAIDTRDGSKVELANKEPSNEALELISALDLDYHDKTIEWKRIMFKSATQNNGRRVELRQYYALRVSVLAVLSNETRELLLTADTRPITVRGRNPAFYDEKQRTSSFDNIDRPDLNAIEARSLRRTVSHVSVADTSGTLNNNDVSTMGAHLHLARTGATDPLPQRSPPLQDSAASAEDQYEYVPISRAYWTPPVDIIYRPHAAHYRVRPRVKRYFGELEEGATA